MGSTVLVATPVSGKAKIWTVNRAESGLIGGRTDGSL